MSSVHSTHCCKICGCKYGDANCPVFLGKERQEFPCESCQERFKLAEEIFNKLSDREKWDIFLKYYDV
jgi:hypothetical protein